MVLNLIPRFRFTSSRLLAELKRDIETVKKEIAETKAELISWVVAVGVLQITIITALLLKLAGTR